MNHVNRKFVYRSIPAPQQPEPTYVSTPRIRFDRLLDCERMLDALHAIGVENWDGYEDAQALFGSEDFGYAD